MQQSQAKHRVISSTLPNHLQAGLDNDICKGFDSTCVSREAGLAFLPSHTSLIEMEETNSGQCKAMQHWHLGGGARGGFRMSLQSVAFVRAYVSVSGV